MSQPPADRVDASAIEVARLASLANELVAAADAAKRVAAAAAAADRGLGLTGLYWRVTFPIPPVLVPHFTNAPTPAPDPPPPPPPPRKHRHSGAAQDAARAAARSWFLAREAALRPGEKPPSEREDWLDAQRDGIDAPRQIIRDLRPESWRNKPNPVSAALKGGASH